VRNAKTLVPLVHECRGGVVEGTFNVKENESEAPALFSQTMQHCGEHNERFRTSATAATIEELLAVHATMSSSRCQWVMGRGMAQECTFEFGSDECCR
jgi:hypothetical protein